MADYKIRLQQSYKNSSTLDVLYPETKSACVIANVGTTTINVANDTNGLVGTNNSEYNLDTSLAIVNKYLTSLKKYVFTGLATDATNATQTNVPASIKAVNDVEVMITGDGGINTQLNNIRTAIGYASINSNNKSRIVFTNSVGNAFEFKDPTSVTVGKATVSESCSGTAAYASNPTGNLSTELQTIEKNVAGCTTCTNRAFYAVSNMSLDKDTFSMTFKRNSGETDRVAIGLKNLINGIIRRTWATIPNIEIGTCGTRNRVLYGSTYESLMNVTSSTGCSKAIACPMFYIPTGLGGTKCTIHLIMNAWASSGATTGIGKLAIVGAKRNIYRNKKSCYSCGGAQSALCNSFGYTSIIPVRPIVVNTADDLFCKDTSNCFDFFLYGSPDPGGFRRICFSFWVDDEYEGGGYVMAVANAMDSTDSPTLRIKDIDVSFDTSNEMIR